jgi:hypothetical protein
VSSFVRQDSGKGDVTGIVGRSVVPEIPDAGDGRVLRVVVYRHPDDVDEARWAVASEILLPRASLRKQQAGSANSVASGEEEAAGILHVFLTD